MEDWNNKGLGYKGSGKSIGVVQGKTYEEILDCYRLYEIKLAPCRYDCYIFRLFVLY